MNRKITTVTLAAGLAAGIATGATAQTSFEDETVTIVYNAGPGGATGLMAQLLSQHIGRHLPGEPEVIAESVPGGALLRGIQATFTADPDGLTVGWLAWSGATRILDPEPLQVAFEEFGMAGGLGNTWAVHANASTGGGIETREDFADLEEVTYGGFAQGSSEIRMAATMSLLGIDMNYVGGFRGGAETLAAMRRGEIDMRNGTVSNYLMTVVPEMIETDESIGLFYWGRPTEDGERSNDKLSDLPTFYDYYVDMRGEAPSGTDYDLIRYLSTVADGMTWIFVTPPETPDEITDIYAQAYADVMMDEQFLTAANDVLGTSPEPVLQEEAVEIRALLEDVSPEVREAMASYVEELTR